MTLVRRLRPLAEEECYARCYGVRGGEVQVVGVERRRPRRRSRLSGEQLRRRFEERMAGHATR
jgi:hypothetical protein